MSFDYKQYYQKNKAKIVQQKNQWYKKNKNKILQKIKQYRQKNKEKINTQSKQWYHNNKEKRKQYLLFNKEKINQSINNKYKTNINFKIRRCLASRMYQSLKNNSKSTHTMKLIGCTVDHLKKHLQRKFTKGMSWSNYGRWHIDHIRPCASFDLSKPEQQRECFHYTNLQPLWAEDNFSKNDKYNQKEIKYGI